MDEADRLLLRRHRRLLVEELRVDQLWDALLSRELFKPHMIEDIQRAGCGSRRDQARQLITDLESRGSQALPLFISCLEETGQCMLASILQTNRQTEKFLIPKTKDLRPETPRPVDPGCRGFGDGEKNEAEEERRRERGRENGAPGNPRGNADLAYVMSSEPCGHCLIINNVNFSDESRLSTRIGSDVDCGKLQLRFSSLHFMVEVKRDLTAKEMGLALLELARRDHSALDCCVVVILSHGCQSRKTMGLRWPPLPLKRSPLAVTPSQMPPHSRKMRGPLTRWMPYLVCPHPVTSLCPTLLSQVLSPGGSPREVPGMWRPWTTSLSSGLTLKTCSPCCSGSLMLFRGKGFINRCLVSLISSGKNFSLKHHKARVLHPALSFTPKPSCPRPESG
ncbi:caspase-9 isoform X3 [Saimiri boliviensis]|uniref:caspase-9 isoform X3 n=1 Tax=Saimiri boliviensis TaxID=27679 RepID=UPI003D76C78B